MKIKPQCVLFVSSNCLFTFYSILSYSGYTIMI